MMFTLKTKDYAHEIYETAPIIFMASRVKVVVYMRYHTCLNYWSISKRVVYGKDYEFVCPVFDYFETKSRKIAREKAEAFMKEASLSELDSIDDFYKKEIVSKFLAQNVDDISIKTDKGD